MDFFATCPAGFEELLADELHALGMAQVRVLRGQVSFSSADVTGAYRVCLWSRLASRVMLALGRGPADDADALYETVSRIPWEDHLPLRSSFAVDAHGTNAELRNTRFVALRTKDAIADRMVEQTGTQPPTDVDHPDVTVFCRIARDRATVGIDLAGTPLFRRGYETTRDGRSPITPLRPDYAAALLALGGWYRACRHDDPTLLSMFSGAGTVVAEAASEALDRAPGLLRAHWGFEGWAGHDSAAWQEVRAEAQERAETATGRALHLLATDARPGAEAVLRHTIHAAGIHSTPTFISPKRLSGTIAKLSGPDLEVCDLSWLAPDDLSQGVDALAMVRASLAGHSPVGALVTLAKAGALDATLLGDTRQEISTYVGRDEARLCLFDAGDLRQDTPSVTLADGTAVPVLVPQSDQFAKRLQKVARLRARWARRELVSCYRVYDSDLPDYAVSVDLFCEEGGPGRWLQVYEYAAPREVDPSLARARLMDVLAITPRVLEVPPKDMYLRVRSHGRGGSQYASEAVGIDDRPTHRGHRYLTGGPALPAGAHLIEEGGLTFEVNFSARLDCGVFLDHRDTRAMLREMAKDMKGSKRFLNLFAYTGTATCYAADGGAKHTTTVDMSRPSLDWARRNMERNGFTGPEHEYVQADVLTWTRDQRHSPNRWDLIFCDAPTFSNSSRMHGSWDVQRDHVELLITLSRLLIRGGTCVFSCNLRSFRPDEAALARAGVSIEDITPRTIPEDFKRNPKVHHCYLVRRS